MGKKRKSVATSLDEVDRTMYSSFCGAANSLSQLYSQAMNHQKLSFQAGERHGLEKIYQWILRQQELGSRVTMNDILTYLQDELDYCGDEPSMSPRAPVQHQSAQPGVHIPNTAFLVSSCSSGQTNVGHGTRPEHFDNQTKNSVFSSALSSPVRRSLQQYHLVQSGFSNGAPRNNESNFPHSQSRDANSLASNDSSMDMHADSPGPELNY